MSLVVSELVSAERLSDGGSYAARLRRYDGSIYELRFQIRFRTVEETQDTVIREFLGHESPIFGRVEEFGSPGDGRFGYQLTEVQALLWEEALDMLIRARSSTSTLSKFDVNALVKMIAVAERRGAPAPADQQFTTWYRPPRT